MFVKRNVGDISDPNLIDSFNFDSFKEQVRAVAKFVTTFGCPWFERLRLNRSEAVLSHDFTCFCAAAGFASIFQLH